MVTFKYNGTIAKDMYYALETGQEYIQPGELIEVESIADIRRLDADKNFERVNLDPKNEVDEFLKEQEKEEKDKPNEKPAKEAKKGKEGGV